MLKDNSLIIKNSAILYIRLIITSITGLVASRILLQVLGASDFGLYSVVGGIVILLSFLNTIIMQTSFRYIAFELGRGNIEDVNKVFNISLVLHISLAFLFVIFAELIGIYYVHHYLKVPIGRIDDAIFVFRLSVLAAFFSILSVPFQGLITAKEKFSIRAIIEILSGILKLGAVVGLIYYAGNSLRLYAVLMAVVLIITSILYILYCRKNYTTTVSWNLQNDKAKYKEMIAFSGWIMIGAGASVGKVQGVALIINSFFGTILNASFGIANQVNSVVLMFSQNVGQVAVPQITKGYGGGNTDRTKYLATYISKYSFFLILLPAIPILLETDYILNLWLVEVPRYTSIFVQLMIINVLIDSMISGIPAFINASGKIKWFNITTSTLMLLCLPFAYLLFRLGYPPYSIIIVYIVVALINTIVLQILIKIILNFDVKFLITKSYLKILSVVLFISPMFTITYVFQSSIFRFVLLSIGAVIWTCCAIYFVGIEKKEKERLISVLNKIFGKIKNIKSFTNDRYSQIVEWLSD